MITLEGKTHIKKYLAEQVATVAAGIALGIGSASATENDRKLAFEVARVPITLKSYDAINNKIVFKAQIPDEFVGKISEAGLVSAMADSVTDNESQVLSSFSQDDGWTALSGAISWNVTNARFGEDTMRFSLLANGSASASLPAGFDLGKYSPIDTVSVAYNAAANAGSIALAFMTDSSNYYSTSFTPSTGYNVRDIAKSAFAATGTPDWSNISEVRITANATAGGATNIDLDGLGFFDADMLNQDLILVAREVFTPIQKTVGSVNEIEFTLGVTL